MNYVLHILAIFGISVSWILGYNLIIGRGKILHFGAIGVALLTAYAIYLVQRATGSYALGALVGLGVNVLVSAFFAWLALRLEGDALGILTISMHLAFIAVVLNWTDLTRGALGIPRIPRMFGMESLGAFTLVSLLVGIGSMFFYRAIDRSVLGRSLAALAENRHHAESLGISRTKVFFAAFVLGGLGAFATVILYPQYIHLLHPNDYAFRFLVLGLMCIVAGGPGNARGVALAFAGLTLLQEALRFLPLPLGSFGPLRLLLFGIILIVAVYERRKTLFPQPRTV